MKWQFRSRQDSKAIPVDLGTKLGISERFAAILWQRNLDSEAAAALFLNPGLRHLAPPTACPGILDAAALLDQGLQEGKRLMVWGDYDVDGVTATALAVQVLQHHGIPVEWHVPDRQAEGYGLHKERIEELAGSGIRMLMTVDCGISDVEAVARARELGMTVIVTDHHLPPQELPNAHALCNPRLAEGPCRSLAGVGVAFLVMAELNSRLALRTGRKLDMRETLDLVALGTLADMVPLDGQNRILAKNGLLKITEAKRPGIAELKVISGFQPLASLSAGQVVFSLAPRINAAGRMADASTALEMLCTGDHQAAAVQARKLDQYNAERRREEERIADEARHQAESLSGDPAFVLFGPEWNQGIIGIVASRLVEAFHKPVIMLCEDGATLKGSGRSIKKFDLHEGLTHCKDLLTGYGGHSMAAGLRLAPENLPAFRQRFLEAARTVLGDDPAMPVLTLDGELDFAGASDFTFLKELELMQPFGVGNPEPVFASPPLVVQGRRVFGPQRNHVNLTLKDETTGVTLHAKAWKQADTLPAGLEGRRIRLAYSPSIDMYNGIANVDVRIRDMELL